MRTRWHQLLVVIVLAILAQVPAAVLAGRVALRERLNVLGEQGYVLVGSLGDEYLVFVPPRPPAE